MKKSLPLAALILVALIATAVGAFAISRRGSSFQEISIVALRSSESPSDLLGTQVQVEGVVIGDYRQGDQYGGFFLQQMDLPADHRGGGVFVRCSEFEPIAIGDHLIVRGVVGQSGEATQIHPAADWDSVEIEKIGAGTLPSPISLPGLEQIEDWQPLEGMLVRFTCPLVVTDTYDLARFGQVTLAADERLWVPTDRIDPNDRERSGTQTQGDQNVAAIRAAERRNRRRTILLDDGKTVENPPTAFLLASDSRDAPTLRLGSSLLDLQGIVTRDRGRRIVLPVTIGPIRYAPRPPRPDLGQPDVTVASFNLLNFFTTIDDGSNGARGADSALEFERQREKLAATLGELDADVVALAELENNLDAERELVQSLNARCGDDRFAGIGIPDNFSELPGGDNPIRVGLIYRRDRLAPVGDVQPVIDQAFAQARTPLAQKFRRLGGDHELIVIANHFKSKGGQPASGSDADRRDGQAAYNDTRRRQAAALVQFCRSLPTENDRRSILIVGDLNAYAQEDPIDLLRGSGFVDLLERSGDEQATYSYVYRGQAGRLDHAFAASSLAERVTAASVWHINACEPKCLDYNTEFNPVELYRPDPFRSSDHDPVLIGIAW